MDVERIAAFCADGAGGNPAGVAILDHLPTTEEMLRVAAEVAYPETAFAAPEGAGWRVRYFAPKREVPFCGHATIALGAALGARFGAGAYALTLNDAEISVEAREAGGIWSAALTSPATHHARVSESAEETARRIFDLGAEDLADWAAIQRISAGADILMVPLATRARLARLDYDLAEGAAFLNGIGCVGAYFLWRKTAARFHARLAFPTGGIYEDGATGAAAAALAGWLRDAHGQSGEIAIRQGEDMGAPSLLFAEALGETGSPVRVSGATRRLS